MSDATDRVDNFLLNVYGYAKIEELLKGNKPKNVRLKDYLSGTIIGTFRRVSYSGEDDNQMVYNHMPFISHAKTTEEIRNRTGTDKHHHRMQDERLPYHISNMCFFAGMHAQHMEDFLRQKVMPCFVDPKLEIRRQPNPIRSWDMDIEAEGFNLYVEGSTTNNSKELIVDFTASNGVIESVNLATSRLHAMIKS
jgi:hypothetical protein